jgi:hypothetical protein
MKQTRHVDIFDIPGLAGHFISGVDAGVVPADYSMVDVFVSFVVC